MTSAFTACTQQAGQPLCTRFDCGFIYSIKMEPCKIYMLLYMFKKQLQAIQTLHVTAQVEKQHSNRAIVF